jgi:hypothetical protein
MKMKFVTTSIAAITITLAFLSFQKDAQKEPWAEKQLMPPAELAEKLVNGKATNTVIFNIGPSGEIKNSIAIGATQEKEKLALLKRKLANVSKHSEVVIYCGCCPFEHCPNIRPAFELLNEMKFMNAKLLNMPKNLKVDWIDKGYPMQK